MKTWAICLAILNLLALVSTHPFVIVHTEHGALHARAPDATPAPTPVAYDDRARRRDLIDDVSSQINSILGGDATTSSSKGKKTTTKSSSSAVSVVTIPPPAIASRTSSSTDDDPSTASSSTSSSATPTTASSTTSTTLTPSPTPGPAQATSTPKPNDSNAVPAGGIAVAVIMSLLILALSAWLIFKYHPKSQAWWAARQERQYQARSYRAALDGPDAGSPNLRQRALAGDRLPRRQATLKSFFAPATAKLGGGKEIKRKPVNWGVQSPSAGASDQSEKLGMTSSAAPMGQIERYSHVPPWDNIHELGSPPPPAAAAEKEAHAPQPAIFESPGTARLAAPHATSSATRQPVSPVSAHFKNESLDKLPPVSPVTASRDRQPQGSAERDLPALPPVPSLPFLGHAKKGSDGVFRLG